MSDDISQLIGRLRSYARSSKGDIFAAVDTIEALRDENKRLRELVKDLEEELKEIGAVSWHTPDQKALDADLLREDAHERKRLEKEYPWKE